MRGFRTLALASLVLLSAAAAARGDTVHLAADFNNKTIDAPIGTGGPGVGEPAEVSSDITAIVRDGPMPSACLEIADNDDYMAGYVHFTFLEDAEPSTGRLVIAADLWFVALDPGYRFSLLVRQRESSFYDFAGLTFTPEGAVYCTDEGGALGQVGTYETGRLFRVILDYNLDAATYDLWLDGARVLQDEPHGVPAAVGIGSVLFGCSHDPDLDGLFYVDAITVSDTLHPTDADGESWGRIKASYLP